MINPDKTHRNEGSFWVSPFNFDPEVTGALAFPTPLGLIDSTLRKVRYTAGATIGIDGFLRIAQALDEAGIRDESLNLDWWGDLQPMARELDLVREVLAGGFGFTTNVFADTLLGDGDSPTVIDPRAAVDLLSELGTKVMAPGLVPAPTPDAEKRQMDELAQVVDYAASAGIGFTVTLAQVGRRDFDQMLRIVNQAISLGCRRVDLMDSTSSLSPEAMKVFITRFRAGLVKQVPVTMHVHDDFGLSTAAAIAAAGAGAGPDVSVNGVSYRCGFAPLEEVVTSLEVLYGVDTGVKLDHLQGLSDLVATEMGVPVPPLKPVTGGYAYLKHMPGDVATCLREGPDTFPPVSGCVHAHVVGATVEWVWDSLSTRAMVRQLAAKLGLDLSDAAVEAVYAALDQAVNQIGEYPRWLDQHRAEAICLKAAHELIPTDA
jgi:isopropylmalate/homocitrate/citramalate synthase